MSVNSGIVDEPDACGTGRDARCQIAARDAFGGAAQIEARPRRPCFGRGAGRAARGLEQERRQQSPARDHSADGSICCVGRTAPVVRLAAFVLAASAIAACGGKAIHLGDGRDGAPTACTAAHVNANEVLWIGDSWILVTGDEHTRVRDLARVAGAIGPNDDYVIGAMAAAGMAAIANQYAAREAGATKVKVVIMDGGTWDTIQGGAANDVATTFTSFLSQGRRRRNRSAHRLLPPARDPFHSGRCRSAPSLDAGVRRQHRAVSLPRSANAVVRPSRIHGSESGLSADRGRFSCGRRRDLDGDAAVLHRAMTFA